MSEQQWGDSNGRWPQRDKDEGRRPRAAGGRLESKRKRSTRSAAPAHTDRNDDVLLLIAQAVQKVKQPLRRLLV